MNELKKMKKLILANRKKIEASVVDALEQIAGARKIAEIEDKYGVSVVSGTDCYTVPDYISEAGAHEKCAFAFSYKEYTDFSEYGGGNEYRTTQYVAVLVA